MENKKLSCIDIVMELNSQEIMYHEQIRKNFKELQEYSDTSKS